MEILQNFADLKNSLFDFVFPPHCLLCDSFISTEECGSDGSRPEKLVCQNCWESLNILPNPFCPLCRAFLEQNIKRCPKCPHPSALSLNRSLGVFDPYYQSLIHHFKYNRKLSIGKKLGWRLGEILNKDGFSKDFDYLMPVPLHPSRGRERGYNQSEIIAEEISKSVSLPVLKKVLLRKKNTRDQTRLTPEEREENVKGAFVLRNDSIIKGKNVLLVDDVMTTGATLKECARVLKDAGAEEVAGVTLVVVNP